MFPSDEYTRRITRLQKSMRRQKVQMALVYTPVNRLYFTGFASTVGLLAIPQEGDALFFTDFRYGEMARKQIDFARVLDSSKMYDRLNRMIKKAGVEKVGYEGSISKERFDFYEQKLEGFDAFVNVEGEIRKLRAIKSRREQQRIREAVRLGDQVFENTLLEIRPGMTEWDIRRILRGWIDRLDAQGESFDCIVSIGANASQPHAHVTKKVLRHGQLLLIDMGIRLNDYCSDLTRTVFVGKPSAKMSEVYKVVLAAQKKALKNLRAGKTGAEIDAIARDYITDAGYDKKFGHGLGHGVGLEIHEAPTVSSVNEEPLKPGMVVTIEPGIYLPGIGGVRIEDMAIVRKDGCENLTTSPKELRSI